MMKTMKQAKMVMMEWGMMVTLIRMGSIERMRVVTFNIEHSCWTLCYILGYHEKMIVIRTNSTRFVSPHPYTSPACYISSSKKPYNLV